MRTDLSFFGGGTSLFLGKNDDGCVRSLGMPDCCCGRSVRYSMVCEEKMKSS